MGRCIIEMERRERWGGEADEGILYMLTDYYLDQDN